MEQESEQQPVVEEKQPVEEPRPIVEVVKKATGVEEKLAKVLDVTYQLLLEKIPRDMRESVNKALEGKSADYKLEFLGDLGKINLHGEPAGLPLKPAEPGKFEPSDDWRQRLAKQRGYTI